MRITKYDRQAIVKAIMADVPAANKKQRHADIQADVVKLMTPECRKIYKTTPDALRDHYVGDVCYDGISYVTRHIVRGDVSEKSIGELLSKYEKEEDLRNAAKRQLEGAIEACTTLKQLNDRLPEFKKYFPTEEKPVANLPALTNVVADLSKLGWPKGSK